MSQQWRPRWPAPPSLKRDSSSIKPSEIAPGNPPPGIVDDQCAINNVRDKGPVVITGCGHAGIINIRRNAQAIAGVASIYALIGEFRRSGGRFEPTVPAPSSVRAELGPKYVAPGHCTGWSAAYRLATQLPEAFIVGSVGSPYHF